MDQRFEMSTRPDKFTRESPRIYLEDDKSMNVHSGPYQTIKSIHSMGSPTILKNWNWKLDIYKPPNVFSDDFSIILP